MKKLLLLFFLGICGQQASAQYPFYDLETTLVCADSAGVKSTLYGLQLYVLGRPNVVYQWYIDPEGNKVIPGGGVTIYDAPCYEIVTETEADQITFESTFPVIGGDYTIPANTYSAITIVNIGAINHNLFIDGASFRMRPGEHYHFFSQLDPVSNEWKLNPEIIITGTGVIGSTNLRLVMLPK